MWAIKQEDATQYILTNHIYVTYSSTLCPKKGSHLMFDNNFGKCGLTHSLTAALDQLRVVASSTSNDPGPRSRQHQQIGQREECRCGLLLTVEAGVFSGRRQMWTDVQIFFTSLFVRKFSIYIVKKISTSPDNHVEKITMIQQCLTEWGSAVDSRRRPTNFKMIVRQSVWAVLRQSI